MSRTFDALGEKHRREGLLERVEMVEEPSWIESFETMPNNCRR